MSDELSFRLTGPVKTNLNKILLLVDASTQIYRCENNLKDPKNTRIHYISKILLN